jgi:hypothetical protein
LSSRNFQALAVPLAILASTQAFAGTGSTNFGGAVFISPKSGGATNNGGCSYMMIGNGGSGAYGVIRFTINYPTFGLQNRATITGATLSLTTASNTMPSGALGRTAQHYTADRLTTDFTIGGGCGPQVGGSPNGGFQLGGACASGNGATYNSPNCNGGGWGWFGGTATSTPDLQVSPINFNVANDVQAIINAGTTWIGWHLNYVNNSSDTSGHPSQSFSRAGTLSFTYSCANGTVPTPFFFSNSCTTCTGTANGACVTSVSGNSCSDPGAPSLSYSCICNGTGYQRSTAGFNCVPACQAGSCQGSGDSTATCSNDSGVGYHCNCTTGYIPTGENGTCVIGCNNASPTGAPCGNGGTCHTTDGGLTWTCACPSGYKSNNGSQALCIEYDGCFDNVGNSSCVITQANNTCADLPASVNPTGWVCTCNNPAYVGNTGSNPTACVNKDECIPKHCSIDGGDSLATCTDHPAPAIGYDCQCNSDLFELGTVGGFETCVDKNECASPSPFPCLNGTCTNIDAAHGAGYSCACDSGYVSTGGKTPTCIHPDSCGTNATTACVTDQKGNSCIDNPPPLIGYNCSCNNPAYTLSIDGSSCIDKNDCTPDHCGDDGDNHANCTDNKAPKAGHTCDCSPGFEFDGTMCADVNECASGSNPCAHGTCNNEKGTYSCVCAPGYELKKGSAAPTCVASASSGVVTYKVIPGDCGCRVGSRAPVSTVPIVLFFALALWIRQRSSRTR